MSCYNFKQILALKFEMDLQRNTPFTLRYYIKNYLDK